MAQEERIRRRLTGNIQTDPSGEVSLNHIQELLSDFHLSVQQVGKFVKECFPGVVVLKGKGYRGISAFQQQPSNLPLWPPPPSCLPSTFSYLHEPCQPAFFANPTSMQPTMPVGIHGVHVPTLATVQNAEVVRLMEENRILRGQLYEARQAAALLNPVAIDNQLHMEISAICSSTSPLSATIRTVADIRNFSVEETTAYIERHAPTLNRLISNLTSPTFVRLSGDRSQSVAMLIIATIANHRNHHATGLQTILSLGYLSRTCNDQLLTTLNHAGMGISSRSVWRVISENAAIMRSTPLSQDGVLEVWCYDNVNIMVKVAQMRKGHCGKMENWTSRLAIPLRHIPDPALSTEPRGRRRDLCSEDFLPTSADVLNLKARFKDHIKTVLTANVESFKHLKKPPPKRKAIEPSTYRPLELMDANEAKTSDNVVILRRFAKEAGMTADNCWDQEIIGDQATCKNIRGAKTSVKDDVDRLERLEWAKECPGDFHFLWETGKCICLTYWSSPKNVGSLAHLKDVVNRKTVDSGGKKFNPMDEFLHQACEAHLIAALEQHLGIDDIGDDIGAKTEEEMEDIVDTFLDKFVFKTSLEDRVDDSVFQCATSLLHHLMLYTDLRQCIRDEDGPAVVAHWRFWLPTFLGTNRSQYSTEAANHLANLMADWSPKTAEVLTHNRGVNTHTREGHGKAVDMLNENYNKVFKQVVKSSGGHLTLSHAQEVSLAVPLIDEARRFCDKVFKARQTVGHTSPSAEADIRAMREKISNARVYRPTRGRRLFFDKEFTDVVHKGMKRITVDKWLDNYLHKEDDEEEEEDAIDDGLEVDYAPLMDE